MADGGRWTGGRRAVSAAARRGLVGAAAAVLAGALLGSEPARADALLVDHSGDASGQPCTSTTDSDCSLRSAIELANGGAGPDSIVFEAGDVTIGLASPLPALTDDETTLGPLDPDQVVEVDANEVSGNVLEITGDDIVIANVRVYGSGTGWANIWVHGAAQGVTIRDNVIGDDEAAPGGCGQSGESHSGVFVSSSGTTPSGARAWITGNVIKCHGRFGDGTGDGIVVSETDRVVIGADASTAAGGDLANTITANAGAAVRVTAGTGNPVRGNSLLSNQGLGIDLGGDGVTPNDAGDGDAGANDLQNFPEVASAALEGDGRLSIAYRVDSDSASSTYPLLVDFYVADPDEEEGQTYVGTDGYLASEAETEVSASFLPEVPVREGESLVATATDAGDSTSEFSGPVVVAPEPGLAALAGAAAATLALLRRARRS